MLSGLVLLSALALGGLTVAIPYLSPGQQPVWLLFGFEVVVGVAAVLGVLFGLGRFAEGPGLALACVSGTILMGSALGWLAANRQVAGHSITPILGFRGAAALGLGLLGAVCVLSRNPKSWRIAAWGVATGLPVLIAAAAMIRPGTRRAIEGAVGRAGTMGTVAAVVGLLILAALLCASVHLMVKAFELGRVETEQRPTASS